MKWMKRLLVALIVLCLFAGAFVGTSYWLAKRKPTWYRPLAFGSREMEAAANRAVNKVIQLHNLADQAASRETSKQWRQSHGAASLPALPPLTVTFTQEELTAFLARWMDMNAGVNAKVDRYITGPQFLIADGQIKFACRINELDQLGVLRVVPSVDDKGMLRLEIVAVSAGSLPLPESFVQKQLAPAEKALRQWLPAWQTAAKIGPEGANLDAVKAALTESLLRALHHEVTPAMLFMPIDGHKAVPMKLTNIALGEGTITLTVDPLTEEDRKTALKNLREPYPAVTSAKVE
jgi:hypothetical protein